MAAARPECTGALFSGGPEGGQGRLRQLEGIALRGPLEVGGSHRPGGTAVGHGGDLGGR